MIVFSLSSSIFFLISENTFISVESCIFKLLMNLVQPIKNIISSLVKVVSIGSNFSSKIFALFSSFCNKYLMLSSALSRKYLKISKFSFLSL